MNDYVTGTFGQPRIWDVRLPASFQHPMAPYDVLVDPQTLPDHPVFATKQTVYEMIHEDSVHSGDEDDVSKTASDFTDKVLSHTQKNCGVFAKAL